MSNLMSMRLLHCPRKHTQPHYVHLNHTQLHYVPPQSVTWEHLRKANSSDPIIETLLRIIENSFPDHKRYQPEHIKQYIPFHEQLSVVDGVFLYKDRILIPISLRQEIIDALHTVHQGVKAMTARVDRSVF